MSNSNYSGCLGVFVIIIPIATWLGTGYLAWNWIQPESFWGSIKFLFAWGILGYIANIIGGLIITGIANIVK